jgi:hypothetical protein
MRDRDTSSGWTTWEVVYKSSRNEWSERPVSDSIIASGNEAVGAFNKTSMVEEMGWPEAWHELFFSTGKGNQRKPRIVRKKNGIYLLKCTPNPWRLYFYVSQNPERDDPNRIVYVYAFYKDQYEEDDATEDAAARVRNDIFSSDGSRIAIAPFAFPPGSGRL